ncbi:tocopherol cyclase family protein [Myxococcota bacterium]
MITNTNKKYAAEKEQGNMMRWDGRKRGFYEVYYLYANDPQSRSATWIRYTVTSPLEKAGEPRCELWGIFFDIADPENNFAVKQTYPIDRFSKDPERFRLGIADAVLEMNRCHGSITDPKSGKSLSWDLQFDSSTPAYPYLSWKPLYALPVPKAKALVPHQGARFSGKVTANGREINLKDARGQQSHLWGTKHALRWTWGHCNCFKEDDSAVFEGIDVQIKSGLLEKLHLKMFYLKFRDRIHRFNSLPQLIKNKSSHGLGRWEFEARNKEIRMVGQASCDFDRMVGVTYQDPDGDLLWCNNTKVATLNLKLFDKSGNPITELTSPEGCAFELVDRKTYPEVPIQI